MVAVLAVALTTVAAAYDASGRHFKELYTLVRSNGIWLITGSKQLP